MSTLNGKRVLLVGSEDPHLSDLVNALKDHDVQISTISCDEATPEKIKELKTDLILLNHLKTNDVCKNVLSSVRGANPDKTVPIFVLVEDSNDKIQEVIAFGATDYITLHDDTNSILQKIDTVFDEVSNFGGKADIDITPDEVSVSTSGVKVFVVEDDPLLRNLLSIKLARSSFPAEFSSDGQHVLPTIKQFAPDVIVLDLMLPGISGFEVLAQLKADETLKNIPVIVFSNRDGQEDRNKAKSLGASAFFVKAMTDLSELVQKIELLAKK